MSTGGAGDDQITITVNDALIPTNQVFNPGDASEIALRIKYCYDFWKHWFRWYF